MRIWRGSFGNKAVVAGILAPLLACALVVAVVGASLPNLGLTPGEGSNSPAVASAKALSGAFREAAKTVQPAVVMIKSEPNMPVKSDGQAPWDKRFGENPFGDSSRGLPDLRRFFQEMPQTPRHAPSGMGSGIVVEASGLILTNNHVVRGGGQITVRLQDGREFKATKISGDPKTDLAVLRIEGADHLKAAKLGDSDKVEVGDWVLALGNPFGLEGTVTAGIVSAKGRGVGMAEREDYIQTDAAINPGNSGGPLVNLDGEVIGINTAISSSSGGNEGVGFAIPINLAKWVSGQLAKDGTVHRARLGVMVQPLGDDLAKQFGLKAREGVLVAEVTPDSPAAKAGMKPGDAIVEFAGKAVSTPQELQSAVERSPAGKQQTITIVRDGNRTTLNANPAELAGDGKSTGSARGNDAQESSRWEKLGMEVQNLTAELAKQLDIKADHGVVITSLQPGSLAERAGLGSGMVILEANRKPIKTSEDLSKALDDKSLAKGVLFLVRTAEGSRFVVMRG
jgi:serine protease Do